MWSALGRAPTLVLENAQIPFIIINSISPNTVVMMKTLRYIRAETEGLKQTKEHFSPSSVLCVYKQTGAKQLADNLNSRTEKQKYQQTHTHGGMGRGGVCVMCVWEEGCGGLTPDGILILTVLFPGWRRLQSIQHILLHFLYKETKIPFHVPSWPCFPTFSGRADFLVCWTAIQVLSQFLGRVTDA